VKSLTKILRQNKLTNKKDIEKFLVGKTVKISAKRNINNYGNIGDTFVVEKVDNLVFDEDPYAQLKDFHNKIYFTDLELCRKPNRKSRAEKVLNIIEETACSLDHFNMLNNIFR